MALTNDQITAQNFKDFYDAILPYLGSSDKGKLTFVGEVRMFYAESAPDGFLICDGTTYDKADYPELVNALFSLTDTTPYEVSGDDTKFKVPDLRGEFLRGTGTNSHTNQGSGAGVGVHQDGTIDHGIYANPSNNVIKIESGIGDGYGTKNPDVELRIGEWEISLPTNYWSQTSTTKSFTSRPTNTSVLFCIAYKDTMVDIDFLSYGGERFAKSDMYDTNERVVGKWIDGKPLYQKSFTGTLSGSYETERTVIALANLPSNIDIANSFVAHGKSFIEYPGGYGTRPLTFVYGTNTICVWLGANGIQMKTNGLNSSLDGGSYVFTLIYTKTTDTADSFKYSTPTDYSTKEKIVGTDVDGKPVYQKTVNFTTPSAFNTFVTVTTITALNLIECIFNGIQYSSTQKAFPLHDIYYFQDGNVIKFAVVADNGMLNKSARITIRYTKTTD